VTEPPRRIDATDLPAEVVAFLEALPPGSDLVVTRDGEPLALLRGPRSVAADPPSEDRTDVIVVATAMRLSAAARAALSAELGPGYVVLDLRAAPSTADVVLVPPSSPQLIGGMRAQFPRARVIVTEVEDAELGVSYTGPVRRMLDAGAEAYLAPAGLPRLAAQLDRAVQLSLPAAGAAAPSAIDAGAAPAELPGHDHP